MATTNGPSLSTFSGRIVAAAPEHRGGFEDVDTEVVDGLALKLAVARERTRQVLQDVARARWKVLLLDEFETSANSLR
jgi:hypothetical protein